MGEPQQNINSLVAKIREGASLEQTQVAFVDGLDINREDSTGITPLFAAIEKCNGPVVTWLISLGADINKLDNTGRNGLHLALHVAHRKQMRLDVATIDPFIYEIAQRYPRADTVCRVDGSHPIGLAVMLNCPALVELLFKCGVNIDMVNGREDSTMLLYAVSSLRLPVAKKLLELGANVRATLYNGKGVLDVLLQSANDSMITPFCYGRVTTADLIEFFEILHEYGARFTYLTRERNMYFETIYYVPPEVFSMLMRDGLNSYTIMASLHNSTLEDKRDYVDAILQHIAEAQRDLQHHPMMQVSHFDYFEECTTEINCMRELTVQGVTYYDIMQIDFRGEYPAERSFRRVVCHITETSIPEGIRHYRRKILRQIDKMRRQHQLVAKSLRLLGVYIGISYDAHDAVMENIARSLKLNDLRNLWISRLSRRNM